MKTLSTIAVISASATLLAISAWAAPDGKTSAQAQASPQLVAKLQDASQEALRNGRNGNKNNPAFGQKSAQIDDLIDRLKSGEQVDPSEIDKALEPAHVW